MYFSNCVRCSGVVGRERMGTAFPHKKLSGNGVPTREILKLFCIITIKFLTVNNYVTTFSAPQTISKLDIRICKALEIVPLKQISKGRSTCSIYYSRRVVSQISSNIRYLNSRTYIRIYIYMY